MRALVLVTVLAAGCSRFFTPPCVRVSRAICQLPDEGDACAFVLHQDRTDTASQDVCKQILPVAVALHDDRSNAETRADWAKAREKLVALGMTVDPGKGRLDRKLEDSGGVAGHMVRDLEDANKQEEDQTNDAAAKVFDDAAK